MVAVLPATRGHVTTRLQAWACGGRVPAYQPGAGDRHGLTSRADGAWTCEGRLPITFASSRRYEYGLRAGLVVGLHVLGEAG